MKKRNLGLLPKIILAIVGGIGCGLFFPEWIIRIFLTINGIFGNYLGFIIPLLIVGLVAPGIAELGKSAGKLLLLTALLAYGFTVSTGFMTFFSCEAFYPWLLKSAPAIHELENTSKTFIPYFTIDMPPLMNVMTALIFAFILGLGVSVIHGESLKHGLSDFKEIIYRVITYSIIPLLPLYIFSIFLNIAASGQVVGVLGIFTKIIIVIFVMTILLLLVQFSIAGIVAKKNPFILFKRMIPAYLTALGTQSSAATIPITLRQTIENDVDEELAGFVIPLCATIHLSGSTMKIVACAMAIMLMNGMAMPIGLMSGFILMLGITMVAAPGVPGGAIMAALGLLESMLGFDATSQGLMVALYIAMDSFGTATNVTGDGAIAVIIDRIYKK